jgi:two-component system cell cycle response regulator DivK
VAGELVLIVEDYLDTQELYRELLSQAGFRVAGAASGEEAVEKALELCPHAILMDLSLPGIDGWEATRQIRQDPRLQKTAIIALSGYTLSRFSDSARKAGCDSYLIKPCQPAALIGELRRLIAEKNQP